jgi:hypothetical protein
MQGSKEKSETCHLLLEAWASEKYTDFKVERNEFASQLVSWPWLVSLISNVLHRKVRRITPFLFGGASINNTFHVKVFCKMQVL